MGRGWIAAGMVALTISAVSPLESQECCERTSQDGAPVLSLEDAVRTALRQSRDIRDARLVLEQAEEQVSQAWGNVFPTIDFSAGYTRNLSPNVSFLPARILNPDAPEGEFVQVQFGADNSWNTTVTAEQPLFSAVAFLGVGAAGRFKTLQNETVRGRTQSVVTRVRVAYYDALLATEQLRLTENSIRRVRESLEETRALFDAGLASEFEVLRLEVELANLEPNLRRAENAERQALRNLRVELDLPANRDFRLSGSLAAIDLDDPGANRTSEAALLQFSGLEERALQAPEELVARSQQTRSDLRQLRLTEQLRKTEMRVEQVEYLPRVVLTGQYSIQAQQNGDPDFFGSGNNRAYGRTAGLQVTLPIFTGFQRDARIDEKRAQLRQAETQTRLAEDQARVQVQNLLDQVEEARYRARGQELAVRQAQRGYDIASAQYREGIGSRLELTDAEVALRQSEFNYAQAIYDYLAARARLDEAVGAVPMVDVGAGAEEE